MAAEHRVELTAVERAAVAIGDELRAGDLQVGVAQVREIGAGRRVDEAALGELRRGLRAGQPGGRVDPWIEAARRRGEAGAALNVAEIVETVEEQVILDDRPGQLDDRVLALEIAGSSSVAKVFGASERRSSGSQLKVTLPWNSLVPRLVIWLTMPPVVRPYSAGMPPFSTSTVPMKSNGTATAPRPLRNWVMLRPLM
jgi:hypothetical protein